LGSHWWDHVYFRNVGVERFGLSNNAQRDDMHIKGKEMTDHNREGLSCLNCGCPVEFRKDEGIWRHAGEPFQDKYLAQAFCPRYGYPIPPAWVVPNSLRIDDCVGEPLVAPMTTSAHPECNKLPDDVADAITRLNAAVARWANQVEGLQDTVREQEERIAELKRDFDLECKDHYKDVCQMGKVRDGDRQIVADLERQLSEARQAVAAEREACAQIAYQTQLPPCHCERCVTRRSIADEIRKRK
jgi:hypothetical protein